MARNTPFDELTFVANAAAERAVKSLPRPPSAAQVARELVVRHEEPARRPYVAGMIGMSEKDVRRYSLLAGALQVASRAQPKVSFATTTADAFEERSHRAPRSLEEEASQAVAQQLGRELLPGRLLVPMEILTRDMTVAGVSGSDYLVGTSIPSFIAALRAASVTQRLGATVIGPLKDHATLPRIATGAATTWLSDEASQITEAQPVIGELALSPKTVGAIFDLSHQLVKQISPAGEALLIRDLAGAIAAAVDAGALAGAGNSGEPLGILNTSGLGAFTGGSLDLAALTNAQTDVCTGNAVVNENALGYATTPAVAALLKIRQRFTGSSTALWEGTVHQGTVEGAAAYSTTAMPAATAIFADWSHLIIAEWGVLEILVDPYSQFSTGVHGLRALWQTDVGLAHAAGFSIATSIT